MDLNILSFQQPPFLKLGKQKKRAFILVKTELIRVSIEHSKHESLSALFLQYSDLNYIF